jgi:hypothetical protein
MSFLGQPSAAGSGSGADFFGLELTNIECLCGICNLGSRFWICFVVLVIAFCLQHPVCIAIARSMFLPCDGDLIVVK